MQICRIAYDAPGAGERSAALLEAHRGHLRSGLAKVVQSGPLFASDGDGRKIGAMVVFDVEDVTEVHRFNEQDPYILHGIYERVQVMRWDKRIG
jgi:uncharacterized protein YciI